MDVLHEGIRTVFLALCHFRTACSQSQTHTLFTMTLDRLPKERRSLVIGVCWETAGVKIDWVEDEVVSVLAPRLLCAEGHRTPDLSVW